MSPLGYPEPGIRDFAQREHAARLARGEVAGERGAVRAADERGDPAGRRLARCWLLRALVLAAEDRRALAERLAEWARAEEVPADALDRLVAALETEA